MHSTLITLSRTVPKLVLPSLALTMRHATLWDDSGTLLVPFPDVSFRIQRPVLLSAAPHLQSRLTSGSSLPPAFLQAAALGLSPSDLEDDDALAVLAVPDTIAATDFAALLDYLSGRT